MLNDLKVEGFSQIYIACGYTDLRYGIHGLARHTKEQFNLNSFEKNTLFLFCGKCADQIKGLLWERDGFFLCYKRLEGEPFNGREQNRK